MFSTTKLLFFSLPILVIFFQIFSDGSAKPMRLPMLMRVPAVECDFRTDTCGINQTLEAFEYHFNENAVIDGRFEYYQLAIKPDYTLQHIGRFQTILFPNLGYSRGCVHVEYNVQGLNAFSFNIIQQQVDFPNQKIENILVHRDWTFASPKWNQIDVNVSLAGSGSQFAFEAVCDYCMPGSTFAVSRLLFSWDDCESHKPQYGLVPRNAAANRTFN